MPLHPGVLNALHMAAIQTSQNNNTKTHAIPSTIYAIHSCQQGQHEHTPGGGAT